ncbi:MAG: ATP-dependent Clp protease proteolytic subunit [Bacteroidia bacterium]|nr:ATP-dependent Clp protease proteolytic subunit [Bacteroidia bacterium]MCX7763508.1 ATP-dependent Clp protease proteolytic subunit [Bacteroidia bacterium]MDW8057649.1 ATP-dependent Clp protease proteolytic subunit [Bacteroidia bacterium]
MTLGNEFRRYATHHLGIESLRLDQYEARLRHSLYNLTPNIIEERQLNIAVMDVFSRLMMDRIIFLGYPIDGQIANIVNAQLLFLESADPKRDIFIYINSPGGSVYDGLSIYDVMQYVRPDVNTICTGMAASMAAVLLAAGAKGKRAALPHARVMIHQPLGGVQGQASDIEIVHAEIQKIKRELYEILAFHTGQPYEKIWKDSDRDYWMRADEARAYGLVDEVLQPTKLLSRDGQR